MAGDRPRLLPHKIFSIECRF